eukprot:CAMPEP_0202894102 /NCGR_PEP_ID=MMETSP1392-20130828/3554_1 /ASSEMBLY_ACC=CAM_ASM_000868 /TAXON_ID=225041 /ORGANISM="Chlamydomonas chlamydogama, Strain SAG 11-48b" /LENGTH=73 /DNA_ID=CAMNT_0049578669 /DNA_START=261 /DNA_END=482 /DNA_ORIENTATION=-
MERISLPGSVNGTAGSAGNGTGPADGVSMLQLVRRYRESPAVIQASRGVTLQTIAAQAAMLAGVDGAAAGPRQ